MRLITAFNTARPHIYINPALIDATGLPQTFRAILDTGAPGLEFSDRFLRTIGLLPYGYRSDVEIPSGLQTHKYGKIVLSKIECLGQSMENVSVVVSKFDERWGVDALIGLDFFRRFRVTVDYKAGHIITEPYF